MEKNEVEKGMEHSCVLCEGKGRKEGRDGGGGKRQTDRQSYPPSILPGIALGLQWLSLVTFKCRAIK